MKLRPNTINIGKRTVGKGQPTYIIFEVASTHENNWQIAIQCVENAITVGADAVKFQLFMADGIVNPITTGLKGTHDYFKTAETPREWFPKLLSLCQERGIDLLCSAFDISAAHFLNDVGIPAVKIASSELTNIQLLECVASFGKPIILSTGMATMEEVERALSVLYKNGAKEISLLQCVSVYPTSFEDANVSAMNTLGEKFGTVVGYSDNGSAGLLVPLMAVASGASIIEKHVTIKKERGSLDDVFSLSVKEFGEMVRKIREIDNTRDKDVVLTALRLEYGDDFDKVIGDGIKRPASHGTEVKHPGVNGTFIQREVDERRWARRGVYLTQPLSKGEVITKDMLILLRPDIGISGVEYETIVGQTAGEDLYAKLPLKIVDGKVFCFHRADIAGAYTHHEDAQFAKMLVETALFD